MHGRPQKIFRGETSTFALRFHVADDIMEMDVRKALHPYQTTK